MKLKFLEAGKVNNTHALRGEVKFAHWFSSPDDIKKCKFLYLDKNGEKALEIDRVRRQDPLLLLSFKGYDSVEKVNFLKGRVLYAERGELDPKGELVFQAELAGLPLIEEKTGETYGTILEVIDRGGGQLYLVRLPDGREEYFPAAKPFLRRLDPDAGVWVDAPEGIFTK